MPPKWFIRTGIGAGTGAILVYEPHIDENEAFLGWLVDEGFSQWEGDPGQNGNVDYMILNIKSKSCIFGNPYIGRINPFGNHAVTVREFQQIYDIFKKYEGKKYLEF